MGSYHHVGWKCLCEICFKLTIGVFIHCLITDALKIKAHPFTSVAYIQIHKKKPIIFLMAKNILRHNNHVIYFMRSAVMDLLSKNCSVSESGHHTAYNPTMF